MTRSILFLFSALCFISLNTEAQTASRLKSIFFAEKANSPSVQPVDSVFLIYKSQQGKLLLQNDHFFGDVFEYSDDRQAGLYLYDTTMYYSYDAQSNTYTLAQKHFRAPAGGFIHACGKAFVNAPPAVSWQFQKDTFAYDAAGNLTLLLRQSDGFNNGLENDDQYTYTYDANGHLTESLHVQWWNNSWINAGRGLFYYDALGYLMKEHHQDWVGGAWRDFTRLVYTYDTNRRLIQTDQRWIIYTGGVPDSTSVYFRYLYTYDNAGNMTEEKAEMAANVAATAWNNNGSELHTYDSLNNRITTIVLNSNSANAYRYEWTYNSFNQPLTKLKQEWNVSAWEDIEQYRYHYELYSTGVASVSVANSGSFRLYPSPAASVLQVSIELQETKPFKMTMYNMQGQIVRQWQEVPSSRTYTKSIPVSDMPAGTYILHCEGENIQFNGRYAVVH